MSKDPTDAHHTNGQITPSSDSGGSGGAVVTRKQRSAQLIQTLSRMMDAGDLASKDLEEAIGFVREIMGKDSASERDRLRAADLLFKIAERSVGLVVEIEKVQADRDPDGRPLMSPESERRAIEIRDRYQAGFKLVSALQDRMTPGEKRIADYVLHGRPLEMPT